MPTTNDTDGALEQIRRLCQHSAWADGLILAGLQKLVSVPADVSREFAHIVAVQEVWLSRLEGRPSAFAIWPTLSLAELGVLEKIVANYEAFLARLTPSALAVTAHYANSTGKTFDTKVSDILLHVCMHSQYHRGKVNVHLRAAGLEPIPTDFITFVRGVPAATTR